MSADDFKNEGNKAFKAQQYDVAIDNFTKAIALEPDNHVLYSNRSGAYTSSKKWEEALADAEKTVELKPDWPKGWSRKGAALHGKGELVEAYEAYGEALERDPNNKATEHSRLQVYQAIIGKLQDPSCLMKLTSNPEAISILSDSDLMSNLQNPDQVNFKDPKMLTLMRAIGATGGASASSSGAQEDTEMSDAPPATQSTTPRQPTESKTEQKGQKEEDKHKSTARESATNPNSSKDKPEPKPEPEPELDEKELAARAQAEENKAKAEAENNNGNKSLKEEKNYKKAIDHYSQAWSLHEDIKYLNNLAIAYLKNGDFKECIETSQKAADLGQERRVDLAITAKSIARIGMAYEAQGNLSEAIKAYKKSVLERRHPAVTAMLAAAQKKHAEIEAKSYIDPEKADEARADGNAKFEAGDFSGAVIAYKEMIKRAPTDPRGYSNLAAALAKTLQFGAALDASNEAIKHDPTFIRAYIRKAKAYLGLRQYSNCLDACDEAHKVDNEHQSNANYKEIEQVRQQALMSLHRARENETEEQTRERLSKDPEIMRIMQDPVMQTILQQAQSDPEALQEHLRNPHVRSNIEKLIAAGVIKVGHRPGHM